MLYTMGWNIVCTHKIILNVFSVSFLLCNVAQNMYHKLQGKGFWFRKPSYINITCVVLMRLDHVLDS
jgi:hypothetical protein